MKNFLIPIFMKKILSVIIMLFVSLTFLYLYNNYKNESVQSILNERISKEEFLNSKDEYKCHKDSDCVIFSQCSCLKSSINKKFAIKNENVNCDVCHVLGISLSYMVDTHCKILPDKSAGVCKGICKNRFREEKNPSYFEC